MRPSASSSLAAVASSAVQPSSSSTTMKKSSSFSFSAVATAAGHTKVTTPTTSGGKLDLAKLSMLAKGGGGAAKKPVDDSFKRWEELRAKKLEALNLKTRRKGGTTIIESVPPTSSASSATTTISNPTTSTTATTASTSHPKPIQPSASRAITEKRTNPRTEVLVKYNHQECIQPPPVKPRIPPPTQQHHHHHKSSHRHRERERSLHSNSSIRRPKISLHPSWYTENIYTNQSMDDSDGDSVMLKRPLTTSQSFSHYNTRSGNDRFNGLYRNSFHNFDFNGNNRTNNININISNTANTRVHGVHHHSFDDDGCDFEYPMAMTSSGQQQHHFERHRNYPKSQSCSFAERRSREYAMVTDARSRSVPKSHSFTGSSRHHVMRQYEMDLIEYQRYKRMIGAQQQPRGYIPSPPPPPPPPPPSHHHPNANEPYVMRICDREGCFSETCLVKNINNSQNISINNNIINNNNINTSRIINEWDLRNKNSNYRDRSDPRRNLPPRETFLDDVESFDDDDFIFNDGFSLQEFPCQPPRPQRQQQNRPYRNARHPSSMMCPDQFYRRNRVHDHDLDDLFRRERSKVLIRNKFEKLRKYSDEFMDDYQKSFENLLQPPNLHGHNLKPSKAMLEVKPPDKYDDTESDSTDCDLDDFNLDFEKYWDELEDKNISTSSTLELGIGNFDDNNNNLDGKSMDHESDECDTNNNPISFINDFYKPTKYSPLNSKRLDYFQKILPPKKINIPSTVRPLGLVTTPSTESSDFGMSMKRPLMLSNIIESPLRDSFSPPAYDESLEQAKFEIIPNKTGLKISPLYTFDYDNLNINSANINHCKLKSTARPLIFW